jgi:hypothetical protein
MDPSPPLTRALAKPPPASFASETKRYTTTQRATRAGYFGQIRTEAIRGWTEYRS